MGFCHRSTYYRHKRQNLECRKRSIRFPDDWETFEPKNISINNKLTMTIKELTELTGGLSRPGKMPGYSFSIPAQECKTGSKLAQIEGTVCHDCYALKGRYRLGSVKEALQRRFDKLNNNPFWEFHMVELISRRDKSGYFRWHDSGDIQSISHLRKIVFIAEQLPNIKFWLPTKESAFVRDYMKQYGEFPDNLIVRISAHRLDRLKSGFNNTSSVTTDAEYQTCFPVKVNGGYSCGDCRACWDKDVKNVTYLKH